MKFILVLFAVVLAVSMVTAAVSRVAKVTRNSGDEESKCLKPCPYTFEPVCAWDGAQYKFFGNECFMEKHNCEIEAEGRKYEFSDMSNCPDIWVD